MTCRRLSMKTSISSGSRVSRKAVAIQCSERPSVYLSPAGLPLCLSWRMRVSVRGMLVPKFGGWTAYQQKYHQFCSMSCSLLKRDSTTKKPVSSMRSTGCGIR
jgi:hypothetical protein